VFEAETTLDCLLFLGYLSRIREGTRLQVRARFAPLFYTDCIERQATDEYCFGLKIIRGRPAIRIA
jgi:hypothetical protein